MVTVSPLFTLAPTAVEVPLNVPAVPDEAKVATVPAVVPQSVTVPDVPFEIVANIVREPLTGAGPPNTSTTVEPCTLNAI